MKTMELIRYHIPHEILTIWCEQESEELLPLQETAVKRFGLFDSGNLLVQAPPSAGKTFIGEMAAIQAALQRKKVIYLVPLKALAEEKFTDLSLKYAPYGLKVIISTRDRREFDRDLEEGSFSIAVVVYEKLAQLLVRRPERIAEIALVVADELEILSDPERGGMVEILITRILNSSTRLIGLSAVAGGIERLAEWMQARLVRHERRPVELRYGILFSGKFRFRTYNDMGEGEESLPQSPGESTWETVMENVHAFTNANEPCLIFVKARHESRRGAELIAARLSPHEAPNTLAALRALEPTHSREILIRLLGNGVAFHNADLTPEERRIVEQGFRTGEIRAVVSTATLATGMNLPARNVFITPEKWRYDARFGMPWKTPILRGEYENMGGRAGRFGAGHPFGRAILIANTPYDFETLWRRYIDGEREQIEPQLARNPLDAPLLRLIASRTARDEEALHAFIERTLTGQWIWRETLTVDECETRIRTAVNHGLDAGILARQTNHQLEATPFGLSVAAKGIGIETAQQLKHWIAESETRAWSPIDLILAAALTPDGRMAQVSLTAREYEHAAFPAQLRRIAREEILTADVPLTRFCTSTLTPFYEEVRAIKTALFLHRWIDQTPLRDIEDACHVLVGQVIAAAGQVSWLIDATAAIATSLGAAPSFIAAIQTLAERVQHGLHAELLPLMRAANHVLPRNAALALAAHGLHTPETLAAASPNALEAWVPAPLIQPLLQWAQHAAPAAVQRNMPQPAPSPALDHPVLIVDERRPGEIILDGHAIRLQDKQYRLIRILAAAPGICVPYKSLYQSLWGKSVVNDNQIHFQKRKLVSALSAHAPERPGLISTVNKHGFTLNLEPSEIRFVPSMPQAQKQVLVVA